MACAQILLMVMALGCASAKVDWQQAHNAMLHIMEDDKGHGINCGDAKHNFTLDWTPKSLNFDQKHQVTVNFDMTPIEDWSSGKACISVYLDPYEEPIYQGCTDANCNMINPYLPGACPFKANKPIKVSKTIPLTSPIPIPPSDYRVEVDVRSSAGAKFLCIKANLHVVSNEIK